MYKITLPVQIDGTRYGIDFRNGIGETDNKKIVERMKEKGFKVEVLTVQEEIPHASDYDSMSDEELSTLAIEKGIDINGLTRRKTINALKKQEENA